MGMLVVDPKVAAVDPNEAKQLAEIARQQARGGNRRPPQLEFARFVKGAVEAPTTFTVTELGEEPGMKKDTELETGKVEGEQGAAEEAAAEEAEADSQEPAKEAEKDVKLAVA